MMKRNRFGCTVIVTCDTPDCGLCWIYDARPATFKDARSAAMRAGWDCVRNAEARRDTCRYCRQRNAPGATTTEAVATALAR